ncbi:FtsX-like permease family protein [Ornithinibacillus xuwenensis]|uniref:FtsX-like permease family protein n=1 Tax=Ornithinibacillus xuwenensis TaxID=3144668 RepID=A0ABU9XJJ7_9BACI
MPLRKKLIRTILEKKAQFLSAWLLIVMSSIVFYSFTSAGANLIDNLDYFNKTNRVEDAHFIVEKPLADLSQFEERFQVKIEKRYRADVSFSTDTTLRLLDETGKINLSSVVKGEALDSEEDILIDQGFAKAHELSIGEDIQLNDKTYHVTGFMAIPDYIYPLKEESGFLKNPDAFGVAVVKESELENLKENLVYYSVRFSENNRGQFKAFLNQNNQLINWTDKKDNNRISFIRGDIEGIKKMGEFLPIAILFISIAIILILLWRLMKKEYSQIGTLYALGYKKSEIIRHYLSYASILAISGSVVGTFLGWLFLHPLLSAFASYYNLPVLVVEPHIVLLIVSLMLPLVFFIPLTYYLVMRVLRITPVSLIKGGELKVKVNRLERLLKLDKLTFKRKFVIREIIRNLPRALFLTIGAIFATVLLLFGFISKNSMEYLVTDNFNSVYHYEYNYIYSSLQTTLPDSGQIGSSAPFTINYKNEKQSLTINGLEPNNTAIQLQDIDGERLKYDSVIINKSLADKIGLQKGDTIHVTNQLSNTTFDITIDHIANSYLGDMIYMPLNQFNQLNGYPSGSYNQVFTNKELDISKENLVSVTKSSDTVDGFKQMIKPLNYGIAGIALVAAIISVIIIYILISLLIEENSFKISLMKVIGYNRGSIRKMMIGYNIWFIIIGFLIGIPITTLSISAFMNSITAEMNVSFPVKIDWFSIIISFSILILSYYISLWLNNKKLKSIPMTEAINRSTE